MGLYKRFTSGGSVWKKSAFNVNWKVSTPYRSSKKTAFHVEWFFDKPAVMAALDDAARKKLSQFGAWVRRTARQSIRKPRRMKLSEMNKWARQKWHQMRHYNPKMKKPFAHSKPGNPPFNQTGKLKDFIEFWYNADERSVTIGPASFGGFDVPGVLELGGHTREHDGRTPWVDARPYMGPALKANKEKFAEMWGDSIKGSAYVAGGLGRAGATWQRVA
jgi:hypothetical protein